MPTHTPSPSVPAQAAPSSAHHSLRAGEDRERSPFTGYTRAHWLEITERLLAGVLPFFDPATGMPHLPGTPGEDGHDALFIFDRQMSRWQAMERIMMLAVFYTAATGRDRVPGWDGSVTEVFRTGIRRMADPASPFRCERTDPSVYMGSETALAILLSPKFFWDPFSEPEREQVLGLLEEMAFMPSYDNNHHLFHMTPVPLLERHGRRSNREYYTGKFERLLGWDRGGGWFIDGVNQGFDYYNFWGFHLYAPALCYFDAPWREQFGARLRPITEAFLRGMPFFFDRDGGPIPWGRSLAYRFAGNCAVAWAHLFGANPLPPGQARRMASGCLKYFWDHGAVGENGLMALGYHGANTVVAEEYLVEGTNYFAAQGLACLLIPAEDPFWTDAEQPLPADGAGGRLTLPGAQMTVRVSPADGEARLFPAGQPFTHAGRFQRGIKYCQHAYSSRLGWCALGENGEDLGAGRVGFSRDGETWRYRSHPVATEVSPNHVGSVEAMEFAMQGNFDTSIRLSGELLTHTLIGDTGELHVFWHTALEPVWLHLGGYGVPLADGETPETTTTARGGLHLRAGGRQAWMELLHGPNGAFGARVLEPRAGWRHAHLFGGRGVFTQWRSAGPVRACQPVILYVDGARDRTPATPEIRLRSTPADAGATRLEIEWEGEKHTLPVGLAG